jgi:stage III sporulation protein AE
VVDFFSAAIPIFTLINTSSGAVSTASAQAFNMNLTLAIIEKFCTGALLPTSFAVFSLGFTASISDSGAGNVARGVKSAFMWGVGLVGSLLAAVIAMQSVVASAADNATLRAARYAASGMIPIVGSTVASALSTLGGGMAYLKSTVGMGSVAVILALSIAPLVSLLLYRLSISACLIYLEFSGSSGGVRCYSAIRAALDTLIAVYSTSVLVCIIEVVVFVKGVFLSRERIHNFGHDSHRRGGARRTCIIRWLYGKNITRRNGNGTALYGNVTDNFGHRRSFGAYFHRLF